MKKDLRSYLRLSFLLIVLWSCQSSPRDPLFKNLSPEETGLYFENALSHAEEFNMIDYLYYYDGGGVAIGDINNDGLSDIYLVSNEGDNGLFLNLGKLKFQDISKSAGVKSPGLWKTGVSMVDVNGDGLLDIYQCRLGKYKNVKGKNELYINQGDLTFKEQAAEYNLDFSGFSTQAAFFDMENDGDLDVYLLNHSVHSEGSFGLADLRTDFDSLAGDRLYRNDDNFFYDITSTSGIYSSQLGYGLGIGLSDINQDGFTDIFVANDFSENDYLYLNNQDQTFAEVYQDMVDYSSLSSMGCDLADFNNDGLVDILTLDMLPENDIISKSSVGEDPPEIFRMKIELGYMPQYKRNMLQLNRGQQNFSEIAMLAGIHATDWSWAPLFADFNNDGWKDLFISNGIKGRPNDLDYLNFIHRSEVANNPEIPDSILMSRMPAGRVPNYFYMNNKDLTFENVSDLWGVLPGSITQGAAYGDLDNDGDLDLVINNYDTLAFIKENTLNESPRGHFLAIELTGSGSNTKAIGSRVELFHGNNYQLYELYPVRGFKSSVDYKLHIGLEHHAPVDSIRVVWPGGLDTILHNVEVDRVLKLNAPVDQHVPVKAPLPVTLFIDATNRELGVEFQHRENAFIEFNREPLIPHMHSREGPALAVADINNDGLDDFFIGGAKHQQASIYLQREHVFEKTPQQALERDKLAEDTDAAFFDFDNDGDQDLLVVSGGNEFQDESQYRQPRLYLNDGTGTFALLEGALTGIYQTGSCIAVHDYDHDGWSDVFLGSQVIPWEYGTAPKSYLLRNDRGRLFEDVSHFLPRDGILGMINDAEWIDLAKNGHKSLVVAGEWMGITIISMDGKNPRSVTIPGSSGWWKSISSVDYDGDGDLDLLAGNLGLNTKLKAPLHLYLEDLDQNGRSESLLSITKGEKEIIFSSYDMLTRQVPSIASSLTPMNFAGSSPTDIFGNSLSGATKLTAVELRSGVFINNDGNLDFHPFPNIMQISFIQDFLKTDINSDGSLEIISGGNLFSSSIKEGRYAADRGTVLTGFPNNHSVLPNNETGIFMKGDVRRIESIDFGESKLIMIARNNDSIMWFKQRRY